MNHFLLKKPNEPTRRDDLLCDRAVFGIAAEEASELSSLCLGQEDDRYELIAASISLAAESDGAGSPPDGLRGRLLDDAKGFDFAAARDRKTMVRSSLLKPKNAERLAPLLLALAASLAMAVWLGAPRGGTIQLAAVARQELLEESNNALIVEWSATDDSAAVGDGADRTAYDWGDVVWDNDRQTGYLRFRGLAPNDPKVEQYQLWVFDADRDERHPVDGGVFDIPSGQDETVVAIDAKLPIHRATMFAITVERPGGVVVSDRSRLPLLAKR